MKVNKKSKKNKYDLGSFVKQNQQGIGIGGQLLSGGLDMLKNPNKANVGLSTGQGILSGASAGAALGPWGMAGGALIGGAGALLGASKQKRLLEDQYQDTLGQAYDSNYTNMNTSSVNPYGTQIYQDGGKVAKNIKKQSNPSLPNWDGMVQKADGTVGMWGNPLNNSTYNPQVGLYPKGNVPKNQVDSLMNLYPNLGLNYINPNGQSPMLGANQSDMVKKMLSSNKFANGGDIDQNIINIEKGELQIDPNSGKVLREYNGINPETAGLYSPHSKGKDSKNNFVTAEPNTFIITKAKASKYKTAIDNNDKLAQQTILQNIRNYKSEVKNGKLEFALGGGVPNNTNPYMPNKYLGTSGPYGVQPAPFTWGDPNAAPPSNPMLNFKGIPTMAQVAGSTGGFIGGNPGLATNYKSVPQSFPNGQSNQAGGSQLSKGLDFASKYGSALVNVGRGIFGNVETQARGQAITNPYQNQVLDNMPQDVNMQPAYNSVLGQQRLAVNDIRNQSNNSAVYRANRQNIGSNTQRNLGSLRLQEQQINNQARGQRAGIYNSLGQQSMREQERMQSLNFQADQINSQNRAAKSGLLGTGLSQMQQVYQNDQYNNQLQNMDKFKANLLPQIYSNLKYYQDTFGKDAIDKLLKGN